MQPGQIILLNGTSSAGKSTLAKTLQAALPEPYLHVGIDTMVFALPKRYLNPPFWHEVFRYIWPPDGRPEGLVIEAGPVGHKLVGGLHRMVAALAGAGNNVVVDHVLLEAAWVRECAELWGDLPALFVGVSARWRWWSSGSESGGTGRLGRLGPSLSESMPMGYMI